ncbi:cystein proteinase inhibitor protein salarin-like [Osmerus mordax]|uniref:cystein proteinase inhibitor protein salarin-like n=1 Tax=Osmerus mordax TaxID=8014 RepID=UPI003510CC1F
MQSVALLVVLVLSVAFVISKPVAKDGGANVDKGFEAWKIQFGKRYASAEEESRRKSFWLVNKKMIEEHNKRAENGLESYTMGLNFFSDLESQEIPMGLKLLQGAPSGSQLNKQLSRIRVRRSRKPPQWPTDNKPNRPKPPHPPPHHMLPEDAHPPPSQIPTKPEPIPFDDEEMLFPHHLNNHPFHSHE